MALYFSLPESEAFNPPPVAEHACSEGRVQGRMARIAECLKAPTDPPLTEDELAEKASKVTAVRYRDELNSRDLLSK